jgi:hypothetical protein
MANETADRIIRQGRALVKAIEGLSEVDPGGLIERLMIRMLLDSYKQRLQALTAALPAWAVEKILSVSEYVGDDRAAAWMSRNQQQWSENRRRATT